MERLARSKAVLELGARLVEQLRSEDDLLGSWMAHYVAELMHRAETASPEQKEAAEKACATAILELWGHRAHLPRPPMPLVKLASLTRALASLDPDRVPNRYYAKALQAASVEGATGASEEFLKLAFALDDAACDLIAICLRTASRKAASAAAPWVKLASAAGTDAGVEDLAIDFVSEGAKSASQRRSLSRLEAFVTLANEVASDLRKKLGPNLESDVDASARSLHEEGRAEEPEDEVQFEDSGDEDHEDGIGD